MKTTDPFAPGPAELALDSQLRPIFDAIANSPAFRRYQNAFHHLTGGTIELVFVHDDSLLQPSAGSGRQLRRFCSAFREKNSACTECRLARKNITRTSSGSTQSVACFAGYRETFVPVRLGGRVFGWLRTDPTLVGQPTHRHFTEAAQSGATPPEGYGHLEEIYAASRHASETADRGATELLETFARLVGALARETASTQVRGSAEIVKAVQRYIDQNIDEPVALEDVADHAGVSPFYLCRLFRKHTGMTMTEYTGRRRIDLAKEQLEATDRQITEIAFDVGFQSLSQFNRSFQKFEGRTPTRYRQLHCTPTAA